jgi:hypothetical protein
MKRYVGFALILAGVGLAMALWISPSGERQAPPERIIARFTPSAYPTPAEVVPNQITTSQEISLDQIAGKSDAMTVDLLRQMSAEQRKMLAFRLSKTSGNLIKIAAFFKAWGELDSYAAFQASKDFQTLSQKESALRAIFEGVTPGNAAQLVDLLASLQPGSISPEFAQGLLGLGVGKWAQIDPQAAANFLSGQGDRNQINQSVYTEVGKSWAAFDPQAALEWADKQQKSYQRSIMLGILNSWVENDPHAAVEYARQHASEGPSGASNASMVANALAANDPAGARAFAESLPPGEARDMAIFDAAMRLAHDDPVGTANWIASVAPGSQAVGAVMTQYAVQDPQGAKQWINTLPVESRDVALSTYASNVRDKADAMLTAFQIANDQTRTKTVNQIADRWRASDPMAFQKWVSSSGLPPLTQELLLKRR